MHLTKTGRHDSLLEKYLHRCPIIFVSLLVTKLNGYELNGYELNGSELNGGKLNGGKLKFYIYIYYRLIGEKSRSILMNRN